MKRFLRFLKNDKTDIKMINATEKGFELIILSNTTLKEILETINDSEEKDDTIDVVWQMKFKKDNYIVYKNCIFSEPIDNYKFDQTQKTNKLTGKKIKVTCDSINYFSKHWLYKDKNVKLSTKKYKDASLLDRMLKIGKLNLKSEENEL